MIDTTEEHQLMVQDCMKRESKLTDWERGFVDSIDNHLGSGKTLTVKQDETLTQIWERVT